MFVTSAASPDRPSKKCHQQHCCSHCGHAADKNARKCERGASSLYTDGMSHHHHGFRAGRTPTPTGETAQFLTSVRQPQASEQETGNALEALDGSRKKVCRARIMSVTSFALSVSLMKAELVLQQCLDDLITFQSLGCRF